MKVLIPKDEDFQYTRCKDMYEYYKFRVEDDSDFDEVINNTLFYSFYDCKQLTLCVYFYEHNEKLWVNGFGMRNKHLFNKRCFETALGWFNCDIWANTPYRDVKWALVQCGFQKVDKNIYVFIRKN